MTPSEYSAVETLRDGRRAEIRALKPADRAGLLEAVAHMSEEARYRRFFAPKRAFSEKEIDFYLNVDFVSHVALVTVVDEAAGPVIAGGGRYIVSEPGRAEVAFSVDDAHQGHGIGSALMRHLVVIARDAGMKALIAEVLPVNASMLKVFERSGLPMRTRREGGVVHVTLDLARRDAGGL
jgi:GNAT superfamily N-acetyltransferase